LRAPLRILICHTDLLHSPIARLLLINLILLAILEFLYSLSRSLHQTNLGPLGRNLTQPITRLHPTIVRRSWFLHFRLLLHHLILEDPPINLPLCHKPCQAYWYIYYIPYNFTQVLQQFIFHSHLQFAYAFLFFIDLFSIPKFQFHHPKDLPF